MTDRRVPRDPHDSHSSRGDARDLRGAAPAIVRRALAERDPLPGTAGFAGALDGRLVRDVLGRQPLLVERDDPRTWAFERRALDDPVSVPAGHVRGVGEAGEVDGVGESGDDGYRRVWTLPDPPAATDREAAVAAVREAVLTSVREAVNDEKGEADGADPDADPPDDRTDDLAVAFSGGVDSALVASGAPDAPCYVVGFPGSHDVEAARRAADAMGRRRDLRVVEATHADLERAVPEVARATGRTNPMDVGIALPLYLVAERAAADGYGRLALGQGADELFGGYAKVVDPAGDDRVDADTVRGARRETALTLPDQLERDALALRAAGVEPVTPLLHDRVVRAALPLPDDLLVAEGERKVALRRAAADRLPASVVSAEKKAVQYGSLVARELDRLARQAGFKRRMDDHVGRYIRSLAE